MKNPLAMVLYSRRPLTEASAREQITALSEFGNGLMLPDRCGAAEPIRTPFDRFDIEEPIRWLAEPLGSFFYQKGRPTHASGEMWNRTLSANSRFPSPRFKSKWTGRFDLKWAARIGIHRIEGFVAEMFQLTKSDFGLLTTEIDRQAKNIDATSQSYQGQDPVKGVPGLYWVNFFSRAYSDWLELKNFPDELAVTKHLPGDGVSIKFSDSPEKCREMDVLLKQRTAIEWLGSDRFFNIRFPNRELTAPNWDDYPVG